MKVKIVGTGSAVPEKCVTMILVNGWIHRMSGSEAGRELRPDIWL